jgi:hypothetical protein
MSLPIVLESNDFVMKGKHQKNRIILKHKFLEQQPIKKQSLLQRALTVKKAFQYSCPQ